MNRKQPQEKPEAIMPDIVPDDYDASMVCPVTGDSLPDPCDETIRQLREALEWYVKISRCEDPIRTPLPNPMGYARYDQVTPCGKCHWCKACAALERKE